MGLLFATNLVMPVGGFGFLDSSLVIFPAVLIAAFGLLLTPVDLATRRTASELRAYASRPELLLAADLVARLVWLLAGIVLAYGIGLFGFGVRPGGGVLTGLVTVLAAGLGGAALVAIGQLLAVSLPSTRAARVLGHLLLYPLVLVSGAVFPLSLLPAVVSVLATVSPVTYLADLLAETWLQGLGSQGLGSQGWGAIGVPALVLLVMFGIASLLAVRRARTAWS